MQILHNARIASARQDADEEEKAQKCSGQNDEEHDGLDRKVPRADVKHAVHQLVGAKLSLQARRFPEDDRAVCPLSDVRQLRSAWRLPERFMRASRRPMPSGSGGCLGTF
jgi:hypothetical protein